MQAQRLVPVPPLISDLRVLLNYKRRNVEHAQARGDVEAEALLHEALAAVADTEFRNIEHEVLGPFAQFLRDRDRDDEAERLDERLVALFPAAANNSARIA